MPKKTVSKRSLEDGGRRERANAAKAANARERNIAQQYLNVGPSIGNLARAAYHWYNSVPWLGGKNENGNIIITGEAPSPGMRNPKSIVQGVKAITKANASKITPAQWTAAQDAAIARGDMAEAQRLRDLHFEINTPGNVVTKEGMPTHNYHGTNSKFNTFDIRFFGRTDYGDRGKGFYFSENRNVSENYGPIVKDVYLYAKTPYKGFGKEKYLGRGKSKEEVVQYLTELHRRNLEDDVKHMINQQKSGSHSPMYDDLGITKDMSEQEIKNLVNKAYNHEDVIPYEVGNLDEADVFLSPYENVVYKPNQIKSAYAVTYDDKGVRVPLGERDNFNINDTRFALTPFIAGGIGYGAYNRVKKRNGGSIHIAPSKRGTFTAAATKHGMGVQEFASKVLRNKDSYSPAMVKKANFARNASKWNH